MSWCSIGVLGHHEGCCILECDLSSCSFDVHLAFFVTGTLKGALRHRSLLKEWSATSKAPKTARIPLAFALEMPLAFGAWGQWLPVLPALPTSGLYSARSVLLLEVLGLLFVSSCLRKERKRLEMAARHVNSAQYVRLLSSALHSLRHL